MISVPPYGPSLPDWMRRVSLAVGQLATPSILPWTEVAAATVTTPPAGTQYFFVDSADHKLKRKDSTGTTTTIA